MKVAVVRYNAGNIRSVINALHRIGVEPVVTDDAAELASADRVIFPGQGEAANTMAYLRESGLGEVIRNLKQPVLGIASASSCSAPTPRRAIPRALACSKALWCVSLPPARKAA